VRLARRAVHAACAPPPPSPAAVTHPTSPHLSDATGVNRTTEVCGLLQQGTTPKLSRRACSTGYNLSGWIGQVLRNGRVAISHPKSLSVRFAFDFFSSLGPGCLQIPHENRAIARFGFQLEWHQLVACWQFEGLGPLHLPCEPTSSSLSLPLAGDAPVSRVAPPGCICSAAGPCHAR
jgi:hypothetical protein